MRGCLVVAALTIAVPVRAETPAERAAKLFEQGRDLATHGDYQHAFEVFTKSYELDRAVGTEMNLADCLEHLDQPVKAIELYEDAARALDASGKAPQAKFARDRIAALVPKVGAIVVKLEPLVPGTTVTLGGQPVPAEATIRRRVVPGPIDVVVEAPGRLPYKKTVATTAGAIETVTVALADDKPAATDDRRDPTRVWISFGVGGAGAVVLIASAFTIFAARHQYDDAKNDATLCMNGACNDEGLSRIAHAQHIADVSTGLLFGGLALAAAGGVLWYTAPREHVTVAPSVGPTGAGVSMSGRF